MEHKAKRIVSWLKKIYEDEPIPEFEVNARAVDILYKIVEHNEDMDRDISLLIEGMKEKTAEYKAETAHLLNGLTESLDLTPENVSDKAKSYLDVLVKCAMTLETKDTSLSSLFCAITDMSMALYETELKNTELEEELNDTGKKLPIALMLEQQLKEDLSKTEEQLEIDGGKIDRQCQNLKFLSDKTEDFKIRVKAAENKLADLGLDQSLMHESLMLLSEELTDVNKEIEALENEMKTFLDLPPSPSIVKVMIEEVKQQLNAVEAELTKEVGDLVLDMVEPRKCLQ
ncbi:HAUS augmin-like complex subunit 1 [Phaenicophaeus curvirostris]|uniref:HAUS augmin-like complex subunit 1 n=1 Tax=Phaenicophaeus curvirostris TaxID=33595 RepID=UPI0037F0B20C